MVGNRDKILGSKVSAKHVKNIMYNETFEAKNSLTENQNNGEDKTQTTNKGDKLNEF